MRGICLHCKYRNPIGAVEFHPCCDHPKNRNTAKAIMLADTDRCKYFEVNDLFKHMSEYASLSTGE